MKASPAQADRLHLFSHDLRNRLIGLYQALERLKEPSTETEREELARYGEQQYFKALREVEQLMDDLLVERGTSTPQVAPLDLVELLNERIDLLRFRFERKQQTIVTAPHGSITLKADRRIVGDLIDALLSNASKFSASGTAIEVGVERSADQVILTVRDHGVGLSPNDLAQVFVRFAWLESRPTGGESQGRGTLARAAEQARAHGGSLEATSEGEGHGCTFSLRLPC